MIPKLRQGKYQMSLEYLIVPENSDLFNNERIMGPYQKDTGDICRVLPTDQILDNLDIKINNGSNGL